ncbi:hypothetical protein HK102_008066, partial [Quaeritorhiza haematococci]
MTHSWLLSLFYDCPPGMGFTCPNKEEKKMVTEAIKRGDITWHALPFNGEWEYTDGPLFEFGIDLTREMDDLLGVKRKTVVSQRDVPGITAAAIPIFAKKGIRAISFGVNGASAPVLFPHRKPFIWKHPTISSEVMAFYLPGGYGWPTMSQFTYLDSCPYGLFFAWNGDNGGGHSPELVERVLDGVKERFGNKTVVQSVDLESVVDAFEECRGVMEVVEGEAGDTWIHGVASDPLKALTTRFLTRLRTTCLSAPTCDSTSPSFHNFSRFLLKAAEHTWGGDVKAYLEWDQYSRWDPRSFAEIWPGESHVRALAETWEEQRKWAGEYAVEALRVGGHALLGVVEEFFSRMGIDRGKNKGGEDEDDDEETRWRRMLGIDGLDFEPADPTQPLQKSSNTDPDFEIAFDKYTGAITHLRFGSSSSSSSSSSPPKPVLATPFHRLGELTMTLYDANDIAHFLGNYSLDLPDWALWDFGK